MATSPGNYAIVVSNNVGCIDTSYIQTVVIGSAVQLLVSANDSICLGFSANLSASGAINYLWSPSSNLNNPVSPSPIANPTSTTTYTVIATLNSCKDTGYVTISVLPVPGPPTIFYNGGILTSDSTTNIQWNLNGNPIPGATSTPYTPVQSGLYTVTYTGANGCSATSNYINVVLSVNEFVLGIDYIISPNPFSDATTISFAKPLDNAKIFLYNTISDKAVLEKEINGDKITIQKGSLPEGIYFFRIIGEENKIAVGKLIIQ